MITERLYELFMRTTPAWWVATTSAALVVLVSSYALESRMTTVDIFHIVVTVLVTGVVGLVGVLYRQAMERIDKAQEGVTKIEKRQRRMLHASLTLWSEMFPDKAAEAVSRYRAVIEDDNDGK